MTLATNHTKVLLKRIPYCDATRNDYWGWQAGGNALLQLDQFPPRIVRVRDRRDEHESSEFIIYRVSPFESKIAFASIGLYVILT